MLEDEGFNVDDFYFPPHGTTDDAVFEVGANRHRGDANIDVSAAGLASESQWGAIVDQAWTGGDTAFTNALATPWPTWTADHVTTPGLLSGVRSIIKKIAKR